MEPQRFVLPALDVADAPNPVARRVYMIHAERMSWRVSEQRDRVQQAVLREYARELAQLCAFQPDLGTPEAAASSIADRIVQLVDRALNGYVVLSYLAADRRQSPIHRASAVQMLGYLTKGNDWMPDDGSALGFVDDAIQFYRLLPHLLPRGLTLLPEYQRELEALHDLALDESNALVLQLAVPRQRVRALALTASVYYLQMAQHQQAVMVGLESLEQLDAMVDQLLTEQAMSLLERTPLNDQLAASIGRESPVTHDWSSSFHSFPSGDGGWARVGNDYVIWDDD